MNAHAGMPFCGMFQFAVPTIQSAFGRMARGQQPFWGVGRLRLSFRGSLEPRSDKCNDLRPFFVFSKRSRFLAWQGRNSIGVYMEAVMAKENKKNPKESIKNIDDFLNYVEGYWNETHEDRFSRYMSWEHCYEHFQESYSKVMVDIPVGEQEKDSLTLWLAWYLASWGMYRGSSGLLCHSYEIHRSVIELLLDKKWSCLNNIECKNWTEDYWRMLKKLFDDIRETYKEQCISATNTLITKILLGTLGCTPAFDNLFEKSISFNSGKNEGILKEHISTFNSSSMKELCEFFGDLLHNPRVSCITKMKTETKKLAYPQMKILDMGFWNFWEKETNSEET